MTRITQILCAGSLTVSILRAGSADAQDLTPWVAVASYRPPHSVQAIVLYESLPSFPWYIQRIEGAPADKPDLFGGASDVVNLDEYAVRVAKPPRINGRDYTGARLLEYVRLNLTSFIDPATGAVRPITAGDSAMWKAGIPGAIMEFSVRIAGFSVNYPHVVLGEQNAAFWYFSTIVAGERLLGVPPNSVHPVSGVRRFGQRAEGKEYVIYTRGADRVTRGYAATQATIDATLKGGDAMWQAFQLRLRNFVNANGGSATIVTPVKHRPRWNDVKGTIHKPEPVTWK